VLLVGSLGFGLVGFMDDYIKIVLKRSLGLTAKQKLAGQLLFSIIVCVLLYRMGQSTEISIPGTGIGWALMCHLIAYAEKEGLRRLVGDVLTNNKHMLDMCRALDFQISPDPEDSSIQKVHRYTRLSLTLHPVQA